MPMGHLVLLQHLCPVQPRMPAQVVAVEVEPPAVVAAELGRMPAMIQKCMLQDWILTTNWFE
jgi:hypothetical protein